VDPPDTPSCTKVIRPKMKGCIAIHDEDEDSYNETCGDSDTIEHTTLYPELGRKQAVRNATSSSLYTSNVDTSCLNFLGRYHCENPFRSRSPGFTPKLLKLNNATRSSQSELNPDCYQASLYIPSHGIILPSQALNKFLYVDIRGLARSGKEGTNGLPHAVLSVLSSENLSCSNLKPKQLESSLRQYITVKDVPSPEDPSLKQNWRIELIVLPQKMELETACAMKGKTDFSSKELAQCYAFGRDDARPKVDITIILGSLNFEGGFEDGKQPPKLIILRFHNMIHHSISSEAAFSLYSQVQCKAGKQGFEVKRTSGTGGRVSEQSDIDLMFAMRESESSLPRKLGACKIVRNKYFYHIFYKKIQPKPGTNHIALITYSPPKDGGSFLLNPAAMEHFPFLGEFSYLKMVATLVILELNLLRVSENLQPIASGPLISEMTKIRYARSVFVSSGRSYYAFIANSNACNSFSLVAYFVGIHNDYFRQNAESLENKILIEVPCIQGRTGRGGSLFRSKFVFALLDWEHGTRTHCLWYVANAARLGLDPRRPCRQRTLLEIWAAHPQERGPYEMYMQGNVNE